MLDKFQVSNKTGDLGSLNKYSERTLITPKIVILKRAIPVGIHVYKYAVFYR